jgi:peptidoglycan/LPS O-acetylase OafA/YrhL
LAVLPIAGNIVEYGSAGWLWALFGLCQRMYVDRRTTPHVAVTTQGPTPAEPGSLKNPGLMRLLACLFAAVVHVWQEQIEFSFSQIQLAAVILGIGILSLCLLLFRRGPSRIQPPKPIAGVLRFIGRRTLEIYAIQLAGSELIIMLLPALFP